MINKTICGTCRHQNFCNLDNIINWLMKAEIELYGETTYCKYYEDKYFSNNREREEEQE